MDGNVALRNAAASAANPVTSRWLRFFRRFVDRRQQCSISTDRAAEVHVKFCSLGEASQLIPFAPMQIWICVPEDL